MFVKKADAYRERALAYDAFSKLVEKYNRVALKENQLIQSHYLYSTRNTFIQLM